MEGAARAGSCKWEVILLVVIVRARSRLQLRVAARQAGPGAAGFAGPHRATPQLSLPAARAASSGQASGQWGRGGGAVATPISPGTALCCMPCKFPEGSSEDPDKAKGNSGGDLHRTLGGGRGDASQQRSRPPQRGTSASTRRCNEGCYPPQAVLTRPVAALILYI
jgi:hypothetical protein